MIRALLFVLLASLALAAAAQNRMRIAPEATGWSSGMVLAPTYVNAKSLAANTAESFTTPTGARFVIFSANCDFYANPTTTATVPGDVTNGSASMLNPAAWFVEGITTVSVISAANCIVTAAYYI